MEFLTLNRYNVLKLLALSMPWWDKIWHQRDISLKRKNQRVAAVGGPFRKGRAQRLAQDRNFRVQAASVPRHFSA